MPEAFFIGRGEQIEGCAGQIFGSGNLIQKNGFVLGQARQKIDHRFVLLTDQKGVIPGIDNQLPGNGLDVGKIHYHTFRGCADGLHDLAFQRDFDRVAVSMQVAALAFVVRNAVPSIEG